MSRILPRSGQYQRTVKARLVAVIGGIWRQPDPVQAAKELVAAVG